MCRRIEEKSVPFIIHCWGRQTNHEPRKRPAVDFQCHEHHERYSKKLLTRLTKWDVSPFRQNVPSVLMYLLTNDEGKAALHTAQSKWNHLSSECVLRCSHRNVCISSVVVPQMSTRDKKCNVLLSLRLSEPQCLSCTGMHVATAWYKASVWQFSFCHDHDTYLPQKPFQSMLQR